MPKSNIANLLFDESKITEVLKSTYPNHIFSRNNFKILTLRDRFEYPALLQCRMNNTEPDTWIRNLQKGRKAYISRINELMKNNGLELLDIDTLNRLIEYNTKEIVMVIGKSEDNQNLSWHLTARQIADAYFLITITKDGMEISMQYGIDDYAQGLYLSISPKTKELNAEVISSLVNKNILLGHEEVFIANRKKSYYAPRIREDEYFYMFLYDENKRNNYIIAEKFDREIWEEVPNAYFRDGPLENYLIDEPEKCEEANDFC